MSRKTGIFFMLILMCVQIYGAFGQQKKQQVTYLHYVTRQLVRGGIIVNGWEEAVEQVKYQNVLNQYNHKGQTVAHMLAPWGSIEVLDFFKRNGGDLTVITQRVGYEKGDKYPGSNIAHITCGILRKLRQELQKTGHDPSQIYTAKMTQQEFIKHKQMLQWLYKHHFELLHQPNEAGVTPASLLSNQDLDELCEEDFGRKRFDYA